MRSARAELPRTGFALQPLRRRVRQRRSVSCAEPGTATCAEATAPHAEAGWRALQPESPRQRTGRLERRALWRLPRLADLARLPWRGRIRGADPLPSSDRLAARTAALAG